MNKFAEIEKNARKIWKKHFKEIEAAVQDDPKKPLFSFLEGPPTANAPPGLHHLEARTFKDIICKFKFMKGFSVPRKGGWDCHGLPVEVQVEKKLNLGDKKEVEEYGIEKFTDQCKKDVFSNIDDWNISTEELNYWIDLENPYRTLDTNYIESVWWSLKKLYEKELLYEGYKVVPFCPRCGTPLSSHEVAQGYKEIKEDSVYIAFKIKGKENEYILAWTTTPWTLPGNVALAVGPEIDYVKIKLHDGDTLILGKEKLDLIKGNYEILEELKGKELAGIEYEPLYKIPETQNKNSHKIIEADFVTTEDGTGVVHTAVMYGEDDYVLGKAAGLPEVHTVGQDGKFLNISPEFLRGRFVKEAEKDIISDLKKRHLLFKVKKFSHTYPFCWRCDSPLLYYGINSWFVKVTEIKDKIIKNNKKINWYPNHIKEGRFGNWLDGAKDWSLSRFKFWGTPLPIWKCSCGQEKIIGSIEELKKEAINFPEVSNEEVDLHKSFVDKIKIRCECGKDMSRIKDVIDCWYDSGSASFAQFHYPFENKEKFEKRFPYDFIAEAIDQTRGWFYTLHVLGSALFDDIAYKNVICMGHVVDENGEKMSKTKGNIIKPREIIDQAGVDAVRLQFCTTDVGNSKRFSYDLMKESVIPFLTILENTRKYYSQLEEKETELKVEDKWILSKLNSLIKNVEGKLENYSLDKAFLDIMNFVVRDFSRGYIRLTRDREDTKKIIAEILEKVSLILAPFAPYISEHVFQEFHEGDSVHLTSWPSVENKKVDEGLEAIFDQMLQIVEAGLRERDKNQVGLKWPLPKARIFVKGPERFNEVEEIIKSQLNVKSIKFESPAKLETEFGIELDFNLSEDLEAEGYARVISRKIQAYRKKLGLNKDQEIKTKVDCSGEFKKILEKNLDLIRDRTNSKEITFENVSEGEEFKIKNFKGKLSSVLD